MKSPLLPLPLSSVKWLVGVLASASCFFGVIVLGVSFSAWSLEANSPSKREGPYLLVCTLSFSPDGSRLAGATCEGGIQIWDGTTGKKERTLKGAAGCVFAAKFSPDGKSIVSVDSDKSIRLWDTATWQQRKVFPSTQFGEYSMAFAPDGKVFATGGCPGDNNCKIRDFATGKQQVLLKGHQSPVEDLLFTPDGMTIVTVSGDDTIRSWEAATGKALLTIENAHINEEKTAVGVECVVITPDGKTIITGGGTDGIVKLWDIVTGKKQAELVGHRQTVRRVALSPDGKLLLTAGAAYGDAKVEVKLWDLTARKQIECHLESLGTKVCVAFSPDGKRIAISDGNDATVKIMPLTKILPPGR